MRSLLHLRALFRAGDSYEFAYKSLRLTPTPEPGDLVGTEGVTVRVVDYLAGADDTLNVVPVGLVTTADALKDAGWQFIPFAQDLYKFRGCGALIAATLLTLS